MVTVYKKTKDRPRYKWQDEIWRNLKLNTNSDNHGPYIR